MTVDEDYNYKELQEECSEYLRNAKLTPGKIVNCPTKGITDELKSKKEYLGEDVDEGGLIDNEQLDRNFKKRFPSHNLP